MDIKFPGASPLIHRPPARLVGWERPQIQDASATDSFLASGVKTPESKARESWSPPPVEPMISVGGAIANSVQLGLVCGLGAAGIPWVSPIAAYLGAGAVGAAMGAAAGGFKTGLLAGGAVGAVGAAAAVIMPGNPTLGLTVGLTSAAVSLTGLLLVARSK